MFSVSFEVQANTSVTLPYLPPLKKLKLNTVIWNDKQDNPATGSFIISSPLSGNYANYLTTILYAPTDAKKVPGVYSFNPNAKIDPGITYGTVSFSVNYTGTAPNAGNYVTLIFSYKS